MLEATIHFEKWRLTLIKSTLSNLPIYFWSIFQMPKSAKERLEKIQ